MPVTKLREFLDSHDIEYVSIRHSPAYTAQRVAASAHLRGKELAKTVMVKIDGTMAMAVVPAAYKVNVERLRVAAAAANVAIASEAEFKGLFPDCDVGAMPPFGNLYTMKVFVAKELSEDNEIAFNAGSHTELIQMSYQDFETLANPTIMDFSTKH